MKKKDVSRAAITLLVFYFLFDAISKLMSSSRDEYKNHLHHKTHQIEDSLDNNDLLFFELAWLFDRSGTISTLIVISLGVIELLSAALLFIVEDNVELRGTLVTILTILLAFDALVVHWPFTEQWHNIGKELPHFSTNLGLIGGVWMMHGLRDNM